MIPNATPDTPGRIRNEWGTTHQPSLGSKKRLTSKRDFPEILDTQVETKLKKTKQSGGSVSVSIAEIKSLVRNPKQFMWVYGVELGYHLPPKAYITWPYIIAILRGKKKLIKSKSLSLTISVPKIEQLSMRNVWPHLREDKALLKFMPLLSPGPFPPRKFFFEVLHTKFRFKFEELVQQALYERRQQMLRDKRVSRSRHHILAQELHHLERHLDVAGLEASQRHASLEESQLDSDRLEIRPGLWLNNLV